MFLCSRSCVGMLIWEVSDKGARLSVSVCAACIVPPLGNGAGFAKFGSPRATPCGRGP